MKRLFVKLIIPVFIAVTAIACEEDKSDAEKFMENAGENIEEAAEEAGEDMEEAGEKAGNKINNTLNKLKKD